MSRRIVVWTLLALGLDGGCAGTRRTDAKGTNAPVEAGRGLLDRYPVRPRLEWVERCVATDGKPRETRRKERWAPVLDERVSRTVETWEPLAGEQGRAWKVTSSVTRGCPAWDAACPPETDTYTRTYRLTEAGLVYSGQTSPDITESVEPPSLVLPGHPRAGDSWRGLHTTSTTCAKPLEGCPQGKKKFEVRCTLGARAECVDGLEARCTFLDEKGQVTFIDVASWCGGVGWAGSRSEAPQRDGTMELCWSEDVK